MTGTYKAITRKLRPLSSEAIKAEQLDDAGPMHLEYQAASPQADALVDELHARVLCWEREQGTRAYRRGSAATRALKRAIAAIVADLLINSRVKPERWSFRSLAAQSFSGGPVSEKSFTPVRKAMKALSLLEEAPGYRGRFADTGKIYRGRLTRFRGSNALMELVACAGIDREQPQEHFSVPLVTKPLVLHGRNKKEVRISRADRLAEERAAQVLEINEYLAAQKIEGGIHRGYRRMFKEGHIKPYHWNKYGRLHSEGAGNYQNDPKQVRLSMKINGETVAELDITASFLSIFYRCMIERGVKVTKGSLSGDPYAVPGVPRAVAKLWINASFGSGKFPTRWSARAKEQLAEEGIANLKKYPCKRVEDAVLAKHPVLADLTKSAVTFNDLCYRESQAVIEAMLRLKNFDVPSLSVYDCLIVPKSKLEPANKWLTWAIEGVVHSPKIKASYIKNGKIVKIDMTHPSQSR